MHRSSLRTIPRRITDAARPVPAAAAVLLFVLACAAALLAWAEAAAQPASAASAPAAAARVAWRLQIDGAIGPATADHLRRGLQRAHEGGAAVLILRIDTPGGLDSSMRDIIRALIASPLPVLAHVAPSGARAASAGTYILYASHVAAMSPGTNLGAATPVALGGGAGSAASGAQAPSASEAKALNDAVAYLRALAEMRGRNADWAERAVRESASASAEEALRLKVIDFIAADDADLLRQAHGRRVSLAAGTVALQTAGLTVHGVEPDWRSRVLGVIGNPNLALILMMIGIYGLLFEFMNPGALVPGVIGGISLLLGLYALSALPLSYAGAALLVLGLGLMLAEAFAPSFGVLGIGGVLAFVLGASLLIDTDAPGFALSMPLVVGVALSGLVVGVVAVRLALRARRQRVVSGTAAMVGAGARVLDWNGRAGHVFAAGERWAAAGPAGLEPGQHVVVRAVRGLEVEVDVAPAR